MNPIPFQNKPHTLAYFSPDPQPTWEFLPAGETLSQWTRLFRIVSYPEVQTEADLDRLSQGLLANYKKNAGQILKAQPMMNARGERFHFLVAGFDQPALKQFELFFVKVFRGPSGGVVQMYCAVIKDFLDYTSRAETFLEQESGAIGHALGESQFPTPDELPRQIMGAA